MANVHIPLVSNYGFTTMLEYTVDVTARRAGWWLVFRNFRQMERAVACSNPIRVEEFNHFCGEVQDDADFKREPECTRTWFMKQLRTAYRRLIEEQGGMNREVRS